MEMKLVADYNFQLKMLAGKNDLENCISAKELALRLWNTFTWKGYIHPEVDYTPGDSNIWDEVHVDLVRQVEAARERGLLEPELMKEAKVRFRLEAFASLDDDTVEYVFEKYITDFDLFDFEEETKALRKRVRGL